MKKILSFALCAVFVLMCVFSVVSVSAEQQTETEYTPIEWSEPTELGFSGSYPRMVALGNGTLLLVHGGSYAFTVRRSSDGGESWSDPVVIADYAGTGYNPANGYFYFDELTETLYLSYRCPIENEDGTYTANVMVMKSTDNGNTWSAPQTMLSSTVPSVDEYGGAWEPTIYRTNGKLRMYYSGNIMKYGDGQVILNLGTEHECIDETYPYSEKKEIQYIVMHEMDEETGAWGGGQITFDGYPNHPYKPSESYVYRRAGMQSISLLSDGTYVMAIESSRNANAAKYGGVNYPMVIDVCFSRDGVNFTEPRTIACGPGEGFTSAAPWVVTLPDGRIAVSYQSDNHHQTPHPTSEGNYKQLNVAISKTAVTYGDHSSISTADFEYYRPFDSFNSDVTYNYWNCLFIDGYKLYALGAVSSNKNSVTPSRGIVTAEVDLAPEGTPEGYTPICTANDMLNLMNRQSGFCWENEKYYLVNDIDLSEATNGLSQRPIGYQNVNGCKFGGVFDGNGKTIRGIDITSSGKFAGLFGYVIHGEIKDLTLYGSVSGTYAASDRKSNGAGGLCGFANGRTVLSGINSYVEVNAVSTAGGIVGYILRNGSAGNVVIKNCANYGKVSSSATSASGAAGGIVGCIAAASADVQILDCENYGAVSGYQYAGGIVGASSTESSGTHYTVVERCTNYGSVAAKVQDVGGIYGLAWYTKISDCINKGQITNKKTANALGAGIVGRAHQYSSISRCVNYGVVYSSGSSILGSKSLGTGVTLGDCYYIEGCAADEKATMIALGAKAEQSSYVGYDFLNTFEIKDGELCVIDRYSLRVGDVDADGVITNADIALFVRVLSGWNDAHSIESLDVNADEKINNRDILALIIKLS